MVLLVVCSMQGWGQSKDSLKIYTAKANELIMKGLYDKALVVCNAGLRLDANNCKFLKFKGIVLSSLGKTTEVKELYISSINKGCNVVLNSLNLKSMFYNEGNNAEALNYLNKVITLKPDSGALYYERWSIKTMMKDSIGGMVDLQKAKKLGCQSAIIMDKQLKLKEKSKVETEEKE